MVRSTRGNQEGTNLRRAPVRITVKLSSKQPELAELEDEFAAELVGIADQYRDFVDSIETVEIPKEKTDIRVADTKLVWVPISADKALDGVDQ